MIICRKEINGKLVTVREMYPEDMSGVLKIFGSVGCQDREDISLTLSLMEFRNQITTEIVKERKIATVLVSEVEGSTKQLSGYIVMCLDVPRIWLTHVAVDTAWQSQGHGILLTQAAAYLALSEGYEVGFHAPLSAENALKTAGFKSAYACEGRMRFFLLPDKEGVEAIDAKLFGDVPEEWHYGGPGGPVFLREDEYSKEAAEQAAAYVLRWNGLLRPMFSEKDSKSIHELIFGEATPDNNGS